MHILMIFLDGVGLGEDDPAVNPFALATTPTLDALAGGHRWLNTTGVQRGSRSLFIPTDPRMGIDGRPQSASGQAAILTGRNVPALIGEHYGPRPNPPIRALLAEDNLFKQVVAAGRTAALLEGYPPPFHQAIASGKRLRSAYQQALHEAGLPLFTEREIYSGDALSVDWIGEGWRRELGYTDTPVYTPEAAGHRMVELSRRYDFAFFSNWYTDVIGHRGTVADGAAMLELFDGVMRGALATWEDDEGLIIITSDHGNMEDMRQGKHTLNDVPTVVIGRERAAFADVRLLSDLAPRAAHLLGVL